jgi:hypothetical protein
MIQPAQYKRIVKIGAWYDLLATIAFATPWSYLALQKLLIWLAQAMALPGAFQPFEPIHVLMANLLGSLVTVWAILRIRDPQPQFGRYNVAVRVLFIVWQLYAVAHGASYLVLGFSAILVVFAIMESLPVKDDSGETIISARGHSAVASERDIPICSQLSALKVKASYFDSYEVPLKKHALPVKDIYRTIVSMTPAWINALMWVREWLAPLLGIRRVGLLGSGVNAGGGIAANVTAGGKMDIFQIFSVSDREIIVGEDDSHLNFRMSLLKLEDNGNHRLILSMIVDVNNWVGKVYLAIVLPFHKIIMKSYLNRAVRSGRI